MDDEGLLLLFGYFSLSDEVVALLADAGSAECVKSGFTDSDNLRMGDSFLEKCHFIEDIELVSIPWVDAYSVPMTRLWAELMG